MKMQLKPGQEIEMCHMFLDCCGEQRTYEKFFGLLAQVSIQLKYNDTTKYNINNLVLFIGTFLYFLVI